MNQIKIWAFFRGHVEDGTVTQICYVCVNLKSLFFFLCFVFFVFCFLCLWTASKTRWHISRGTPCINSKLIKENKLCSHWRIWCHNLSWKESANTTVSERNYFYKKYWPWSLMSSKWIHRLAILISCQNVLSVDQHLVNVFEYCSYFWTA